MGRREPPRTLLLLWMLCCVGCTKLGPIPAMSGLPIQPIERPGVEVQAGVVPGYYLSSSVQEEPEPAGIAQLALVLEPDELFHVPGVFAGARYAGENSAGAALEPLIGYRTYVDEERRFSLGALGFFAYATADERAASFSALRGGAELGVDARLTPASRVVELHVNGGATLTALDADGDYCLDGQGRYGVDCEDAPADRRRVAGSVEGFYPSAHVGVSVDFARHWQSFFHGARLALDVAGGTMPVVVGGEQQSARPYSTVGLSLTLGFGARERATPP